ncbi:hypothetical protein Tph_c19920 [Thermacetogenium phaeum DSM 12270]|uniref:Uncharacterized protein n=1 Tax=Thermacetogenium phaeum (strain ATCC BAA-254 / DSM 26808 / PB) TaxID=1089553 RepID=K4LGQ0_THEPS|nr:hypothetical protein Tph_c19920 [Thermacetogenium phaeum DSM 12270]
MPCKFWDRLDKQERYRLFRQYLSAALIFETLEIPFQESLQSPGMAGLIP